MPNDDNKIILEFPATNVEIELGETITFDNISGFLDSERVTYNGESLTEKITHLENDKADTTYVDTELAKKADKTDTYTKMQVDNALNNKMDKSNPTGTGSFSLNRRANTTIGYRSVATGYNTTASGMNSHSEGATTTASGMNSHSEGATTTASGNNSHSEGFNTTASGNQAHSEGTGTIASGNNSHSEGAETTASGERSHAEGLNTEAKGNNQHVSGKYNIVDNNDEYAEIIGNGTSENNRSNARTLDWDGNETLAGDLTYNGNKSLTSEISRLDGRITDLPEAMVFKGTLGVGGTIETLPTASASNEGWMFKCITAGTYAGLTLKVGDTVTCFNPPNTSTYYWDKTGSQDTDTDTWRNIKVNGVEKLGNGISSGAVDFEDTTNVKFEFDDNGNKVRARLDGIYTESDVDDLLDDKADADNTYTKAQVDDIVYNILPDDTASGSVANFDTSLELPIKSLEVDVNAVQESGTPTPATPLPISGWSEINLVKCGANLWDEVWELGTINNQTGQNADDSGMYRSKNYIQVPQGVNLYLVNGNSDTLGLRFYDSNKNFISARAFLASKAMTYGTNDLPTGTAYIRFVNTSTNVYLNNIAINYPSSDNAYHAFNGNTEVINLGGTYYGGHLTQDKDGHRQLTITYGVADISELSWNRFNFSGVYCFYVNIPLMKTNYAKGLSSAFEFVRNVYNPNALANNQFLLDNGTHNGYCYLRCDDYSDVATFKTAMAGQKLIYELATPIIIDLPDGEPIITLNGTNNIYADTGDCAVEYKCSVAEYVANHSGGGGAKSLGGVFLGGSNSGSEEEPTEESEETEKTKEIDDPKEEIKTIGDMKKLGGE